MISKEGEKTYVDFIYIYGKITLLIIIFIAFMGTHICITSSSASPSLAGMNLYLGCCAVAFYFTFYYGSIFMSFDRNYQA